MNNIDQLVEAVKHLAERIDSIEACGGRGKRTVWELTQIIEAKQKLNDELKRRFSSEVATGRKWDNESARLEFLAHAKEIKQLNEQLAGMMI